MKTFKTVDDYIKSYPAPVQKLLKQMRQTIKKAAPKAEEGISYGMPVYKMHKPVVFFGAFKKHIGFFPMPATLKHFAKELKDYKTSKGTVQFPYSDPLPLDLVKKMTMFRVQERLMDM